MVDVIISPQVSNSRFDCQCTRRIVENYWFSLNFRVLHNATGLDVRVRKIEPHLHSESDDGKSTDVYLYAVDPLMNTIIEMDVLQQ